MTTETTSLRIEIRFIAPGIKPEQVPLRAVSDVLSAVQDLASGRDPFEMQHVPTERGIGLVDVYGGSAVYACVARAPDEARHNFGRVGRWLAEPDEAIESDANSDGLVAALSPIETLSAVAKSLQCRLEIALSGVDERPYFAVQEGDFQRISSKLLMKGETTVVGRVERVGGAGEMRCLMRVPGRRRALYCDVASRELARRLGQCLYEEIAATGQAVWIHRMWRIYRFKITDFKQPRLGKAKEALEDLRRAGLDAWDNIGDPDAYIRELRS